MTLFSWKSFIQLNEFFCMNKSFLCLTPYSRQRTYFAFISGNDFLMFRLSDRFGKVKMWGNTKVSTADNYKWNQILRINIVNNINFMNIVGRCRSIDVMLFLLFMGVRQTLITEIFFEINIVKDQARYWRGQRNQPDDKKDDKCCFCW